MANINTARATSWSNIGKDVSQCRNLNHVLTASGLDYEVTKKPVFAQTCGDKPTFKSIPNRFVTTRSNDGHMYDVVSDKFQIVQNRDAFDFVNYMGDDRHLPPRDDERNSQRNGRHRRGDIV